MKAIGKRIVADANSNNMTIAILHNIDDLGIYRTLDISNSVRIQMTNCIKMKTKQCNYEQFDTQFVEIG